MTIYVPKTPSGHSIFCDDVRQEVSGKMIYIGVYQGELIVLQPPPIILPTFNIIVTYLERPREENRPVVLKVFIPGAENPIVDAAVPIDAARAMPNNAPDGEDFLVSIRMPMRFSPLVIEAEGLIKVRAYIGDDEIRLGTLRVRVMEPSEQSGSDTPT